MTRQEKSSHTKRDLCNSQGHRNLRRNFKGDSAKRGECGTYAHNPLSSGVSTLNLFPRFRGVVACTWRQIDRYDTLPSSDSGANIHPITGFAAETATFVAECAEDDNDSVVREAHRLKNAVETVAGRIEV